MSTTCGCSQNLPLTNCNICSECPPTNAVNLPACIGGEPCEDLSTTDCVELLGSHLPALGVLNSDRLTTILTKLHKVVNSLLVEPLVQTTHTATAQPGKILKIKYLGLGPVYTSSPGATNAGATINVTSTTGLNVDMTLEVIAGTGSYVTSAYVVGNIATTSFTASASPRFGIALADNAVIRAYGSTHTIFEKTIIDGSPFTFKAFVGSVVIITADNTGTIAIP